MKNLSLVCAVLALLASCTGSADSQEEPGPDLATEETVVPPDATADVPPETGGTADLEAVDSPELPALTPGGLPLALPFALERDDKGEPLTDEELTEFTRRITGFWKEIDYFTWIYEISHGVDASTGYPDYLIWWHDVDAVKEGDTVTFRNNPQYGGSHNNAVPTDLVLVQAIAGYLMTGDAAMGRIVEQFAKSNTACMEGFVFDENDEVNYLLARNIVTFNHEFVLPSGKKKAVDYTQWYFPYEGWNANRYNYPDNPTWGDLWVTTMRSKDDVPYVFRSAAWLPYVIEMAPDESVRAAAQDMLEHVELFAKDIVDSGWKIRSKDEFGQAYVPEEDLAHLDSYVALFPDAECDARLGAALMGYGDAQGVDCGDGQGSPYDSFAGEINYFNYQIVDHFHLSALHLALVRGQTEIAKQLLHGMIKRLEGYRDPAGNEAGMKDPNWGRDISLMLLKSASLGMPLTSDEVRQVHQYHDGAVEAYASFPNWDLWDPSVPDGAYSFRDGFQPKRIPEAVEIEAVAFLLEYCWSPFRNPAGRPIVDCEVVRDPSRWGE